MEPYHCKYHGLEIYHYYSRYWKHTITIASVVETCHFVCLTTTCAHLRTPVFPYCPNYPLFLCFVEPRQPHRASRAHPRCPPPTRATLACAVAMSGSRLRWRAATSTKGIRDCEHECRSPLGHGAQLEGAPWRGSHHGAHSTCHDGAWSISRSAPRTSTCGRPAVRTSCCRDTAAGGAHWDDLLDDDIDAKEASPRCWTYDLPRDRRRGRGWGAWRRVGEACDCSGASLHARPCM